MMSFVRGASFSAKGKCEVPVISTSSAGWFAFSNILIDCSVGVIVSFAVCKNRIGRGAMSATTSSALKLYMLQAVSTGISIIAFGERFFRRGSGMGTASNRLIHMLL